MYKRIVLKLSGEALAGERGFGLDADKVAEITAELAEIHDLGVEIGLVVGGGNFFRGVEEQARQMDRVSGDNMGMLSTVINAIALQDALEQRGVQCRVMTAVFMNQIAEPYIRRRAVRHLEKGAWSSLPPAPGIRSSPPIQRPACAPWRSKPMCC